MLQDGFFTHLWVDRDMNASEIEVYRNGIFVGRFDGCSFFLLVIKLIKFQNRKQIN